MGPIEWINIADIVVAAIGIIVGIIGGKEIKEANTLKVQIKELNARIDKVEVNNSQVANVINNNNSGLSLTETENVATRIAKEHTKDIHKVYWEGENSNDIKKGDILI